MESGERIQQYYDFDGTVVEAVEAAAGVQNRLSFRELADRYNLADGTIVQHPFDDNRSVEYLMLAGRGDAADEPLRIVYNPMSTPIDPSTAMRAMRLYEAGGKRPLMFVGTPAALGNRANVLRREDVVTVRSGDLEPVVAPSLKVLADARVRSAELIGYSCGADLAATAAGSAAAFDIVSMRAFWAEPAVSPVAGLVALAKRFARSGAVLDDYVQATNSQPLYEARAISDVGPVRYFGGLLRLSNMAIATALSASRFESRASSALSRQPGLRATIAWGSASEISDNQTMWETVANLEDAHDPTRIGAMVLRGMHHAGGDDIDLYAAMVLQGLGD